MIHEQPREQSSDHSQTQEQSPREETELLAELAYSLKNGREVLLHTDPQGEFGIVLFVADKVDGSGSHIRTRVRFALKSDAEEPFEIVQSDVDVFGKSVDQMKERSAFAEEIKAALDTQTFVCDGTGKNGRFEYKGMDARAFDNRQIIFEGADAHTAQDFHYAQAKPFQRKGVVHWSNLDKIPELLDAVLERTPQDVLGRIERLSSADSPQEGVLEVTDTRGQ